MFPLWNVAIAPIIAAAGAKRVVEIGAFQGETTALMLERLGEGAVFHVIDPEPSFDPSADIARFGGRFVFHRDTSHNVLEHLEPVDVALIDGDHNWFTVYNELRLLAATARRAGVPLPVLIMHDVGWPYGRRDLYYAPERIPEEYRQPYRQKGMRPGTKHLLKTGGLNPTMYNAEHEGGPRNGVMTALDDFAAEHDRPLRIVVLPIYYGLAIVAEQERLDARPELAAALDHLESRDGRYELLQVSEEARLRAMLYQHNHVFTRSKETERATQRYLRTVKAALLDEHYLENELRLAQLTRVVREKKGTNDRVLRDPVRQDQEEWRRVLRNRLGPAGPEDGEAGSFFPYTAMGRTRLNHLEQCLQTVRLEEVPGDLVECGTGRGGGAIFLRAYLDAYEIPDRKVWVADRFRSSPEPDRAPKLTAAGIAGFRADLNLVRDGFARFELLDDQVRFLQGPMDATLADAPIERVALLRTGHGIGGEVRAVLDHLYDRVVPGGFVIVDDYNDASCRKEVDAFRAERGIETLLERVDRSAVVWRKAGSEPRTVRAPEPVAGAPRAPVAPPLPEDAIDLTVVVVMYNMKREAERTLAALSRAYQEGVDGIDYEVIVVENGSAPGEKLGPEFVARFGPEFRYLDLGERAMPSPVFALNEGIRAGRGRAFALMIDGAHVVTPGVIRFGLTGLETYSPAIVATQQWYIGPGQQGDAMDNGYDQEYEDRLFDAIRWPAAGYRLFEIGHFVGDRDWFDGVWESNCMFAPRSLLEQVGCFDESFSIAGGGYANLELYERLGSAPDITVVSMIGEGSFHQLHGGTTTNQPDATERRSRVYGYSEQFADMRGRNFRGPGKPIHYVGRIGSVAARRTKPRRLSSEMFADGARAHDGDGRPVTPIPVPDELESAFTEAVWRSLPWERTTWLGHRIETAPTDLLAYQELIVAGRPDWIVETGTGDGGRALFLASICELVGHGRVVSVDESLAADRPQHPRLQYVEGVPDAEETVRRVRDLVGDGRALVVLGDLADRITTTHQFDAYAPLVPVGSHVVVADTIVNGHPVWPAFGPGPAESVKQILNGHGEFAADPTMEKYSLTFNPGGFLKRVR
jgi:cephalosporin hydroxylase